MFGAALPSLVHPPNQFGVALDQTKLDKIDPMQNQLCKVCGEPAAGFHFGAFTCEGCKSFFGRTCNNQNSVVNECRNNFQCVINKKNRTACKACRLKKCLNVGMSKSGSRYGRRSNWFKIHCLMQQHANGVGGRGAASPHNDIRPTPQDFMERPPPARAAHPPAPPQQTISSTNGSNGLWRPHDSTSPVSRASSHSPVSPPASSAASAATAVLLQQQLKLAAVGGKEKPQQQPPVQVEPRTPGFDLGQSSLPDLVSPAVPFPGFAPGGTGRSMPASAHAFPFLPPTFNFPAFSSLPLHKQAMLSPLLASGQMIAAAAAAAARNKLLTPPNGAHSPPSPPAPPPPRERTPPATSAPGMADILAEHKAFIERFKRLQEQAAAAAAAAVSAAAHNAKAEVEAEEEEKSSQVPHNNNNNGGGKPMDLTKRSSSDEDEEDVSSMGSEILPHLSDTDEETTDEMINARKKSVKESPLDLTR